MFGEALVVVRFIIGGAMIAFSIFYVLYAYTGNSVKSKYAAKIRITDELIELKTSFRKPAITLSWTDITHIQFGSYRVSFQLPEGIKTIHYETSAEQSIQLKQLLRASAGKHRIQVADG